MKRDVLNADLKPTKDLDFVISEIEGKDTYFGVLCAHAFSYFASGSNDRSFHSNIRNVIKERALALCCSEEKANGLTNRLMTGSRQYVNHVRKSLGLKRMYCHVERNHFTNKNKELPF